MNPTAVLQNIPFSFEYELGAKDLYLTLLLVPLLFTPLLSFRWLLPSIPWLLLVVFWSPLLGQGGVGLPFVVWSQWSSFVIPFLFVAAIHGFDRMSKVLGRSSVSPSVGRKRVAIMMVVVTLAVVLTASAFSPILPQSELSLGDNIVPNNTAMGEIPHPVWPTPIPNASLVNSFISSVPIQDSVLTQNVLGSRLAEREAPIIIFGQSGWNPSYLDKFPMEVIVVDLQLPDMAPYVSELTQMLDANSYSLTMADPSAGLYLYTLVS